MKSKIALAIPYRKLERLGPMKRRNHLELVQPLKLQ